MEIPVLTIVIGTLIVALLLLLMGVGVLSSLLTVRLVIRLFQSSVRRQPSVVPRSTVSLAPANPAQAQVQAVSTPTPTIVPPPPSVAAGRNSAATVTLAAGDKEVVFPDGRKEVLTQEERLSLIHI